MVTLPVAEGGDGETNFVFMKHRRPTSEEITARAYRICLENGRRHGHDLDDWLRAEHELMPMPVRKLAGLAIPTTSNARADVKSIIQIVRAAML